MLAKSLLTDFLKSRRARLRPTDVGLDAGGTVRRTPGLRRAEAARLAGISEEWYSLFEMGRQRARSSRVVGSVSTALRLTDVEHEYLGNLVNAKPPAGPPFEPVLDAALDWGFHSVEDALLVAYDRWMTALRWNDAAQLFLNLESEDRCYHNELLALFRLPQTRQQYGDAWERHTRLILGLFRRNLGRDPYNADAWSIVDELRGSADFDRLWAAHDVHSLDEVSHAESRVLVTLAARRFGNLEGVSAILGLPGSGGGYVRMITPRDEVGVRLLQTAVSLHRSETNAAATEASIERSREQLDRSQQLLAAGRHNGRR